ncbi:uncharacterized protein VTP21DRAFT_4977 [Calcarisporiella thermophila]|uniref:uncharacterized protein n=1 Tax=Calcarisporiella thermophila TaxID=911321 RepID=UPI0037441DA8
MTTSGSEDIFGGDSSALSEQEEYDSDYNDSPVVSHKSRVNTESINGNFIKQAENKEENEEEKKGFYSLDEEEEEEEVVEDSSDEYDEESSIRKRSKSKSISKMNASKSKSLNSISYKKNGFGVPYDPVHIPLGEKAFEQILWYRTIASDPIKEEFLVKYKNMSYRHLEWIPRDEIEGWNMGKNRIKRFLAQFEHRQVTSEKDMFNSDYANVERILDEGELEDPITGGLKVYYLTKWRSLPYEQSTWESKDELKQIAPKSIELFYKRREIPETKKTKTFDRMRLGQFNKLIKSPRYKFDNQLRPYQLEGVNWLLFCWFKRQSSILADEMGLGKTVQSVTFLNEIYHQYKVTGPFIIVAPLSTVPHWERAFDTWTDLNVVTYRGNETSRNLIVETEFFYRNAEGAIVPGLYKFDVLITTYEMVMPGAAQLKPIHWQVAIFDEAHRLKSKTSKVSEMLKQYRIAHKVLLTGTPLQNSTEELWALLNFMEPERFRDERMFMQEYGSVKTSAEVSRLQELLKPLMLRRFKEDVEKTIPVKEETIIEVELTSAQKRWYRAILEKNFSFLKKGPKGSSSGPTLTNIMMELRKVCIHPYLIQGAEERINEENNANTPEEQFKCLINASGKLVLLDKLLKKLKEGGHKVLIFSQFTSCLDILADYLRGRNYNHERIDGSIRGEQRQEAIDRFSTRPLEESFVFLLCTRAGGVGINLTAADTVVIFDSDWNPQNDLQAQARCHRIGQTKRVQIYRLICRNTYEREMFDRAGLKLGLDKAVMQKMDMNSSMRGSEEESDVSSKPLTSLNKKEIEELLKKGVYGAMLDDEASAKFCAEDIDQILERRTTVIRHEGNEKGSIFSKASFAASSTDEDVDLNDPDFWDKWAKKANLNVEEVPEWQELIVMEPRQRKKVQRFGTHSVDTGEDTMDSEYDDNGKRGGVITWSLSEKTKYERKLMVYGYGMWQDFSKHFSRRQIKDLKAVTRGLILKIIQLIDIASEDDRRLVQDLETIIAEEPDPIFSDMPTEDHVPFHGASKKQIIEYKSFLVNTTPEYHGHIEKKARNIALRLQMLYTIREKIVPKNWEEAKGLPIPRVSGIIPTDWWGEQEDRDLLLGIVKHGYSKYEAIRSDPEFCFHGRSFIDSCGDISAGADGDEDNLGGEDELPKELLNAQVNSETGTPMEEFESRGNTEELASSPHAPGSDSNLHGHINGITSATSGQLLWPTPAILGVRLRRIIAAFVRDLLSESRRAKFQVLQRERELRKEEKKRQKEERAQEKQRQKQLEQAIRWTKKEKADFLKTIMSFGVEVSTVSNELKWERFRELSGLNRKDDEALTIYYSKMVKMCQEAVERQDPDGPSRESSIDRQGGTEKDSVNSENDDRLDPDPMSGEKSMRLLKRIEVLRRVREQVLTHKDVDEFLGYAIRTGMPRWWKIGLHDKDFLLGLARHGINRSDLILSDRDLDFIWVKEKMDGDEEFQWLKESQVMRRVDYLCNLVLRGKRPTGARRRMAKSRAEAAAKRTEKPKANKAASKGSRENTPLKSGGIKLKLKLSAQHQLLGDSQGRPVEAESSDWNLSDGLPSDSGDDTDEMLAKASKQINEGTSANNSPSGGKKRKAAPSPHSTPSGTKRKSTLSSVSASKQLTIHSKLSATPAQSDSSSTSPRYTPQHKNAYESDRSEDVTIEGLSEVSSSEIAEPLHKRARLHQIEDRRDERPHSLS